jgi:hypothetical protein
VADETITDGDTKAVGDAEDYDTDSYHDNSTNNTRITIPAGLAGYYMCWCDINWSDSAVGKMHTYFTKNGGVIWAGVLPGLYVAPWNATGTASGPTSHLAAPIYLAEGEYVELLFYPYGTTPLITWTNNPQSRWGIYKLG